MKVKKYALLTVSFLLVFLLLSPLAYAERLTNLYTLTSPVLDTSDKQRAAAANALLQKLLVRISGTEKVLDKMPSQGFIENPSAFSEHPSFKLWSELRSAQNLVNQFSYTANNQAVTLASGEVVRKQNLELTFDEGGVKQLLRRLQAPVWDADRPKVLFWVALESRNGRTLITPTSNEPLSKVIASQSEERGIPYQLPDFALYPATDTLFSDVWGGFSQQIIAASEAYKPDAIAVGKIKASGSSWHVEWRLFTGMGSVLHSNSVATLRDALQEGVYFTAEELSSRYASQTGQGAGTYQVVVNNVRQVEDYAALYSYLNGLSLTSKVRLVESAEQRILFQLTLRGGLDQLRANLALDGRLKEESFLGLLQSVNYTETSAEASQVKAREQADAYFRWQAN